MHKTRSLLSACFGIAQQYVSPKYCPSCTGLNGVTSQKMVFCNICVICNIFMLRFIMLAYVYKILEGGDSWHVS